MGGHSNHQANKADVTAVWTISCAFCGSITCHKKLMASELEAGLECGKSDREIGTLDGRFTPDPEGSRMYETER